MKPSPYGFADVADRLRAHAGFIDLGFPEFSRHYFKHMPSRITSRNGMLRTIRTTEAHSGQHRDLDFAFGNALCTG